MPETEQKLPYQMDERELVIRFLKRRADFWRQFAAHHDAAKRLRKEAELIELGRHSVSH